MYRRMTPILQLVSIFGKKKVEEVACHALVVM